MIYAHDWSDLTIQTKEMVYRFVVICIVLSVLLIPGPPPRGSLGCWTAFTNMKMKLVSFCQLIVDLYCGRKTSLVPSLCKRSILWTWWINTCIWWGRYTYRHAIFMDDNWTTHAHHSNLNCNTKKGIKYIKSFKINSLIVTHICNKIYSCMFMSKWTF